MKTLTKRQADVVNYLRGRGFVPPTQIGGAVWGKGHHSASASPVCKKLVALGVLKRSDEGHYALCDVVGEQSPATETPKESKKTGFWSCKLNQPATLKRHEKFETAAKRVGDYGVVFSESDQSVKQVFWLSNGKIHGYDVEKESGHCSVFDFDIKALLRQNGVLEAN